MSLIVFSKGQWELSETFVNIVTLAYTVVILATIIFLFIKFNIVIDEVKGERDAELIANTLVSCQGLLYPEKFSDGEKEYFVYLKGHLDGDKFSDSSNIKACVNSNYKPYNVKFKSGDIPFIFCSNVIASYAVPVIVFKNNGLSKNPDIMVVEVCGG